MSPFEYLIMGRLKYSNFANSMVLDLGIHWGRYSKVQVFNNKKCSGKPVIIIPEKNDKEDWHCVGYGDLKCGEECWVELE